MDCSVWHSTKSHSPHWKYVLTENYEELCHSWKPFCSRDLDEHYSAALPFSKGWLDYLKNCKWVARQIFQSDNLFNHWLPCPYKIWVYVAVLADVGRLDDKWNRGKGIRTLYSIYHTDLQLACSFICLFVALLRKNSTGREQQLQGKQFGMKRKYTCSVEWHVHNPKSIQKNIYASVIKCMVK